MAVVGRVLVVDRALFEVDVGRVLVVDRAAFEVEVRPVLLLNRPLVDVSPSFSARSVDWLVTYVAGLMISAVGRLWFDVVAGDPVDDPSSASAAPESSDRSAS